MPHRTLPLLRIAALGAVIAIGAVVVPAAATDRVVIVRPGDTLSQIALEHGVTVAQLRALNGIRDPNRIYVGQRLRLTGQAATPTPLAPATAKAVVHVVAAEETLTGIARRYGTTIAAIVKANGIANPSYLRVGQRLTLPGAGGSMAGALGPTPKLLAGITSLVTARAEIGTIIRAEANAGGVPAALALAVAWQESGWQARVVSRAGAVGVMQLTRQTADWVATTMLGQRIDLYDARSNVRAGVTLLRHYLDRYHGDRALALAAYSQGQTAADLHGVYAVTRPYIASILALEKFFQG
ncbi:MAG: LysM peptidoglycan-binding domain-containing protein [Candidatus Limnocylindria bacterium]